jgi:ABC-2 type transport system permease protein
MKTLFFLLEKEFKQLLRNKGVVRTLFIAPIIQLILMPLAADYSVKHIHIAVVDNDHSTFSRKLINKIGSSGYFTLTGYTSSYKEALVLVEQDKADLALHIPSGFERNLVRENSQKIYISVNAISGTKASLGSAYLSSIMQDFNNQIRIQWLHGATDDTPQVTVASYYWYNTFMNYHLYMVPAILVTLVTALAAMQSAFNIVAEKESGTIEQINVTPIKKHIFIIGKLLPFLVLCTIIFTIGLILSRVLYISLIVYLFAMLGLGLLISTYSNTQMQAMSLAFFFINIFNMLSGVFTSIDSMPRWAQIIVETFPPSHFIKIMRMVVLKGSNISDITYHLGAMFVIGLVFNTWAVLNYRKTA